jgi:hypothetical protein
MTLSGDAISKLGETGGQLLAGLGDEGNADVTPDWLPVVPRERGLQQYSRSTIYKS